jgi:hypothetical protein
VRRCLTRDARPLLKRKNARDRDGGMRMDLRRIRPAGELTLASRPTDSRLPGVSV